MSSNDRTVEGASEMRTESEIREPTTVASIDGEFSPEQVTDSGKSEPVGTVGEQELDGLSQDNIVEGSRNKSQVNTAQADEQLDAAVESAAQ